MFCKQVAESTTDYLERILAAERLRDFESHVALCSECARYVAQMKMTIRLIAATRFGHDAVVRRSRNS
jgi:anti-sigma factor RsiW